MHSSLDHGGAQMMIPPIPNGLCVNSSFFLVHVRLLAGSVRARAMLTRQHHRDDEFVVRRLAALIMTTVDLDGGSISGEHITLATRCLR